MDRLLEYIKTHVDQIPDCPKRGHSGIRIVPTLKELSVVRDNPMLSEQAKTDLSKLLENRPDLCMVILQLVSDASKTMNNCIADGTVQMYWSWSSHKLDNIFVYQHTFPNLMEEPIDILGYGPYLKIPKNFKLGLLIHLDFHAKDVVDRVQSRVSVGNLWCGCEEDERIQVNHSSCILVP